MTLPESPFQIDIGASLSLTLHKAATRQVDAAIDALQAGDYDVALTLAGAAEGMVERTGHHLFGWLKQHPKALQRFNQREWISNQSCAVPAKIEWQVAQTGTVSSVDEEKPIANQAHALSAVPNWAFA